MKIKKLSVFALSLFLAGALLAGCGTKNNSTGSSNNDTPEPTQAEATEPTAEAEATPEALTEIIVGASIEPHATILNSEAVKNALAEQGYSIKVVEYTDYIQPNSATEDGSLDANFFQHVPYLEDFNSKNGTHLVAVSNIHFEPLGLYPGKTKTIDALPDKAKVAVPNDTTNEARALILLEKAGLIKLKENLGLKATVKDITENPKKIEFYEIEAAQTAKVLQDVDLSVINGNYALTEGLSATKDGLLVEDVSSDAAKTYTNVIVVKEGNEESDKTKALIKAVTSEETKKFIEEHWQGAVVPVF